MKRFLLLLSIVVFPVCSAQASEIRSVPLNELAALGSSKPLPDLSGALPDGSGSRSQVAALSGGLRTNLLEPPMRDLVSGDGQEAGQDDFELKIPEEELPDADIPLTLNSKVEYFITYFQTAGRKAFARWLSRSERYIPMMKQVLKREKLPEDLVYLAMIESGFSPRAYSSARAVGPWQFMSSTGKRYSLRITPWIDERRDPLKSTVAAAMYLKELYGTFNKDWYLAAASYNAGENKIQRAIDIYNSHDFWQLSKGSYLKRETREYVPRLLAAAIIAKEPAKYGFADVAYLPPVEFDTLPVPTQTDLEVVAKACNVPYQTLRDLNPELKLWATPPECPGYQLKVPKGMGASCEAALAMVPADERFTPRRIFVRYRMKRHDTLASVARRYGTTSRALAELNHLGRRRRLRGRVITIPVETAHLDGAKVATAGERTHRPTVRVRRKRVARYYTVKKGDTLFGLAKRFSVSARILSAWNNLREKAVLRPGRRLIVAKYVEHKREKGPSGDENT